VTATHPVPTPAASRGRRALLVSAIAAVASIVGCDDPFAPKATTPNFSTAIEVWALTGAPTSFPTVILVPQALVVRPDAGGSFDVGFDIDPDGRLLVVPMSKIVSPLAGVRSIGIIRTATIFNTILDAPRDGWIFDSTLAVNVGQSFLLRVQTQYCEGELNQEVFAKYNVVEVDVVERRIVLSGYVNPNCGFRSFQTGIPTY